MLKLRAFKNAAGAFAVESPFKRDHLHINYTVELVPLWVIKASPNWIELSEAEAEEVVLWHVPSLAINDIHKILHYTELAQVIEVAKANITPDY